MSEPWEDLAPWWLDVVRDDPRDSTDLLDVLDEVAIGTGGATIDIGCGEGQVMRHLGAPIVGTDISSPLLSAASTAGPVVRARLPGLGWIRPGTFDRAVCVGVVEMIDDHRRLFAEIAAAVRPGGHLLVVMNHPAATAPSSEPLADPDGQILWQWGAYLADGEVHQAVEDHEVTIFHRPMGDLLSAAAAAGWRLDQVVERGPSPHSIARHPELRGQEHIPCVLGCRWTRDE